jgi:membrane-associated protease RseP (regulator of RpoE activity)
MDGLLAPPPPRRRFPTVNVLLFVATVATTTVSGWVMSLSAPPTAAPSLGELLRGGLPFSAALLGILLAHEMGHWVAARWYGMEATLPYFIPFAPWDWGIGTLGAVIRIRSRMPSRRAVLDVGAAGPFAGFVVAVPVLLWGYAHSPVIAGAVLGTPSPLAWVRDWMAGTSAGAPPGGREVIAFGQSLASWAALHLTHPGLPAGADVAEHPVAIAGWFGLLVTALNLVPVGQLDGGHVLYALLGRERAARASRLVAWGLLVLGLTVSVHWLVWFVIARFVVKPGHPPAVDEAPLGRGRRALAITALVLFALTVTPVPIRGGFLP